MFILISCRSSFAARNTRRARLALSFRGMVGEYLSKRADRTTSKCITNRQIRCIILDVDETRRDSTISVSPRHYLQTSFRRSSSRNNGQKRRYSGAMKLQKRCHSSPRRRSQCPPRERLFEKIDDALEIDTLVRCCERTNGEKRKDDRKWPRLPSTRRDCKTYFRRLSLYSRPPTCGLPCLATSRVRGCSTARA